MAPPILRIHNSFISLHAEMESNANITTSAIEQGIRTALKKYETSNNDISLSDLYLYYDGELNTLLIYDDMENLLYQVSPERPRDMQSLARTIRPLLKKLDKEGLFNKDYIYKPFTVNLVDEDFIVTEEILFLDEDTLKLDNELWTGIEKELDDFLKDLLK